MSTPPEILAWRLFYADGTTRSSADGSWEDAPDRDVQFLVLYGEPPLRVTVTDDQGVYRLPGHARLKHGGWMDDEEAFEAVSRAARDTGMP